MDARKALDVVHKIYLNLRSADDDTNSNEFAFVFRMCLKSGHEYLEDQSYNSIYYLHMAQFIPLNDPAKVIRHEKLNADCCKTTLNFTIQTLNFCKALVKKVFFILNLIFSFFKYLIIFTILEKSLAGC